MIKLFQLAAFAFLLVNCQTSNKMQGSLQSKIAQLVADKDATVGVSILDQNGKDVVALNADGHFPLQSVYKLHIALAVLSQIDEGKFSLEQAIEVQEKDLLPNLWSPLREKNPTGGNFTIATLMEYTVSLSDNVGCDVLLRHIGGPKVVDAYCKNNGITDLSIQLDEETQQAQWDLMFQNWTTPRAASDVLATFYHNKNNLLSQNSHDFIWKVMRETGTGQNRLKGQLPKGTVVAHKTGTSGTNKEGLTGAVNDIGIVFLPNGDYFFISVLVANSKENEKTNEKIIADIAKVAYDHFAGNK